MEMLIAWAFRWFFKLILTLFTTLFFTLSALADTQSVSIPLRIDYSFIKHLLIQQVFTGNNGSLRPWDDGKGCNFLSLSDPVVDGVEPLLRVTSKGQAQVGAALGNMCIPIFNWTGRLETSHELSIVPDQNRITAQVVDTRLLTIDGQSESIPDQLWTVIKSQVHPRLESLQIDLNKPVDELKHFLPLLVNQENATPVINIIDTLRLSAVSASEAGVQVNLRVDVAQPQPRTDVIAAPVKTLSADEIIQWQHQLDAWDGFFTFVLRQLATDSDSADIQEALLELLLDTRYSLTEALEQSEQSDQSKQNRIDPVRSIFLATWERLTPIVRQISLNQSNPAANLHYFSFIAAGDALKALDELGDATRIDISLNGLRRLARMVAPADQGDPLEYDEAIDGELRRTFNFGEPLPLPETPVELNFFDWFISPSYAADSKTAIDPETAKRLNLWIPQRKEMEEYLPLAHKALNHAADSTLEKKPLDQRYHQLFRQATLATAWQESCWRQFVNKGGKRLPLSSRSASVGIMQVNPRVWRGFYDVTALKYDLIYNARAGSEILMHYLLDIAIKKGEHTKTNNADNLARASYSAYNAGPGKLTRYRDGKATTREKRVDKDFWKKYQAMKKNDPMAVLACYGG